MEDSRAEVFDVDDEQSIRRARRRAPKRFAPSGRSEPREKIAKRKKDSRIDDAQQVRRSFRLQPVNIKMEDQLDGKVKCPLCGWGILATMRGCNVFSCVNHSPQFHYFCCHCKAECEGAIARCSCPKRNDAEARVEAQQMRNRYSAENPIELLSDDDSSNRAMASKQGSPTTTNITVYPSMAPVASAQPSESSEIIASSTDANDDGHARPIKADPDATDPADLDTTKMAVQYADSGTSEVSNSSLATAGNREDVSNKSFDLDKWAEGLDTELSEEWKMDGSCVVVSITILTKQKFEECKTEKSLENWNPCLTIRSNENGIEMYGSGMCGPGASFGAGAPSEAAKFLLEANGTFNAPVDNDGLLYISIWDLYNPDVYLGDLWDEIEDMFHTAEHEISPIPGPWTHSRLTEALEKISSVVHVSPPDEPEFLYNSEKIVKLRNVKRFRKRVKKALDSWGNAAMTLSIARKGWDTPELVCPAIVISADDPNSIELVKDWEGDWCESVHSFKEAARGLLADSDEWRSPKLYGMYVWPEDFFGEERIDVANEYAGIGLLEADEWTEENVASIISRLWSLLHDRPLPARNW